MLTWVQSIVNAVPCKTYDELNRFMKTRPQAKNVYPEPELVVGDHWFSFRRHSDVVTGDELLEIYLGSEESGKEYMGYDRIDPRWLDAEGRDERRWELTRAYMRPKYRCRHYSIFLLELVLGLARKNKAKSVVAYPRHVAMLITLLDLGFRTMDGIYDEGLRRTLRQGKVWYRRNASQRQLYYAQEFRPFIQQGSFIMEKRVSRPGLWEFLMHKV